jgi:hypothetical protein
LVEIGSEGGLRHNSPLKRVALLRRGYGRGPLRRRTELATKTSPLAKLANSMLPLNYFYFYLCYFALGKNKMPKLKVLRSNWSLRSSLFINTCPFSYKGTSIYRRSHPNYTFSIPDKRLYTLFKGTTVTLGFVRASSVSSHGRAPLHAAPFISSSYGALYTSDALTCGVPL